MQNSLIAADFGRGLNKSLRFYKVFCVQGNKVLRNVVSAAAHKP